MISLPTSPQSILRVVVNGCKVWYKSFLLTLPLAILLGIIVAALSYFIASPGLFQNLHYPRSTIDPFVLIISFIPILIIYEALF